MSDNHFGTSFRLPGQGEEQGQGAEEKGVDENFLPFYKIELLAGRNFLRTEEVFNEFIVNEKVITALGWTPGEAIGQHLIINEGEATIVGVIKDFHSNSLKKEIGPCILLNSSMWLERSNIKLGQNSDLSKTLPFIEKTWKELYPGGFYRSVFLDDIIARNYIIEQFVFKGFTLFSLLTITIGCLGLYGLLSYVTIRKRKEVGIRKVLGASVVQIAGMFSKEFARLLLLTFFIATPVAYYLMGQWLQDFAYRIELSWWIIASGALLTVVIVFATISYQSIRAALTNPIDSLRSE
ncbi:MAG: FtsX-like permease family protein [Bacteroidota bacterium]